MTRRPTAFEQWLVEHGACQEARDFVAARNGDFERSLRDAAATDWTELDSARSVLMVHLGYIDWRDLRGFGRFLRREATARGWIAPRAKGRSR